MSQEINQLLCDYNIAESQEEKDNIQAKLENLINELPVDCTELSIVNP